MVPFSLVMFDYRWVADTTTPQTMKASKIMRESRIRGWTLGTFLQKSEAQRWQRWEPHARQEVSKKILEMEMYTY